MCVGEGFFGETKLLLERNLRLKLGSRRGGAIFRDVRAMKQRNRILSCRFAIQRRMFGALTSSWNSDCVFHLLKLSPVINTSNRQSSYIYTACRSCAHRPRRSALLHLHRAVHDGSALRQCFATQLTPTPRQHLPHALTTRAETLQRNDFNDMRPPSPPTLSAAFLVRTPGNMK